MRDNSRSYNEIDGFRKLCLVCGRILFPGVVFLFCFAAGNAPVAGDLPNTSPELVVNFEDTDRVRQPFPIPESETHVQTVQANKWFDMPNAGHVLEGAVFDKEGNLLFCDSSNRRIMQLSPKKKLTEIAVLHDLVPAGLALHGGRIYVAAISLRVGKPPQGAIYSMLPDGSDLLSVVPESAGYAPDDLVFDKSGGFYFTDFKGKSTEPDGGLYYVHPGHTQITSVLKGIGKANGVALSPDGNTLWITEYANNRILRLELADPVTVLPNGSTAPYYFNGPAPDSIRVDTDGNVYVAMHRQGRILILNSNGIPIGQILIPGREKGHFMKSTSLAIFPDKKECLILTGDGDAGDKTAIFSSPTFSKAPQNHAS